MQQQYRELIGLKMIQKKRIWITWEDHRRSRELANVFNAELFYTHADYPAGISHILDIIDTIRIIKNENPSIIFVQNPSIVLAAFAGCAKFFFGYRLIVDRHTNFRIGKKKRTPIDFIYTLISDISIKTADLTIVTNDYLKFFLENKGGTGFVLPDKIPELVPDRKIELLGKYNIAFICTFADDEPFLNVIGAASKLPEDTVIYVTGNYKKNSWKFPSFIPKNIVFTGFLPEQEYINLLFSVDAVMDFTDLDWCLVCGGYEAIAAEKPFITSNKQALRDFFDTGAIFSDHSPEAISNAINKCRSNSSNLTYAIKKLKLLHAKDWWTKFIEIIEIFDNK